MRKIDKKNLKKGVAVEPLVLAAFFIVILSIALYFTYTQIKQKSDSLSYLPDYNLTVGKGEKIEIIGFDLGNGKMKYYDGSNWLDIPIDKTGTGILDYGDRKLEETKLIEEFRKFYFEGDRSNAERLIKLDKSETTNKNAGDFFYEGYNVGSLPVLEGYISIIYDVENALPATIRAFPGDVRVYLIKKLSSGEEKNYAGPQGKDYGQMIVHVNGKISFLRINGDGGYNKEKEEIITGYYENILEGVVLWRDSVFKKPISLEYTDKNSKSVKQNYCVRRISLKNAVYLTVDLNRPFKGEECP